MFTATSLARLEEVHPELKRRVMQLDQLVPSLSIQVAQGLRTWAEQDALWQKGRDASGETIQESEVVTKARGGQSAHNFGYAVDIFPEDSSGKPDWNPAHDDWKRLLSVAPTCGLAEGAVWRTFKDSPHFYLSELPANPTDAMREQFLNGGLAAVWAAFQLPSA